MHIHMPASGGDEALDPYFPPSSLTDMHLLLLYFLLDYQVAKKTTLGGSGWSAFRRYAVEGSDKEYFVKTSSRNSDEMFLGEVQSLAVAHLSEPCSAHLRDLEPQLG